MAYRVQIGEYYRAWSSAYFPGAPVWVSGLGFGVQHFDTLRSPGLGIYVPWHTSGSPPSSCQEVVPKKIEGLGRHAHQFSQKVYSHIV